MKLPKNFGGNVCALLRTVKALIYVLASGHVLLALQQQIIDRLNTLKNYSISRLLSSKIRYGKERLLSR